MTGANFFGMEAKTAMEGELWDELYPVICTLGKRFRSRRVQISNTTVVMVHTWAVLHDRPTSWACRMEHWPGHLAPATLPSPATMSRRMRSIRVLQCLEAIDSLMRDRLPRRMIKTVDAKPLPVGSYSKDKDARWGQAGAGKARGYKLFAICDGQEAIDRWCIGSMNQAESKVAQVLIRSLPGGGYLLGDALYDVNRLYAEAAEGGWQLVAPRQKPNANLGHGRHHPGRHRSIELLTSDYGKQMYKGRTSIERYFGHLGNFGAGLGPLPNWVRRPHRVAAWVQMKIIINAVRVNLKEKQSA